MLQLTPGRFGVYHLPTLRFVNADVIVVGDFYRNFGYPYMKGG
jgi:hypothetical protein